MFLPEKSQKAKSTSIVFYSLYIPLLIILAVLLAGAGNFTLEKVMDDGSVLSSGSGSDDDDDDDDSGSGSSNDDDDDDDDDDDNSGSGSSNDDDNDDDDNNNSGSGSSSNETKTRDFIVNDDGTTTETRREEGDDGEIKLEVRTYDADGNKIEVRKYEQDDDGEIKVRYKVYDSFGNKLSDFRLRTEDGKELELRIKEGNTEITRVIFDIEDNELIVKTGSEGEEDGNRLRIRTEGNNFVLTRSGVDALSRFPISVDADTGEIFVDTPAGEVMLTAMPDTIVEKAVASDDLDDVGEVTLDTAEGSPFGEGLEYVVTGTVSGNLFGLFDIQIPSVLIFDAETGDFVSNEQSFISRILNLFSF